MKHSNMKSDRFARSTTTIDNIIVARKPFCVDLPTRRAVRTLLADNNLTHSCVMCSET